MWILGLPLLIIALVGFAGEVIPFTPYTIYSYQAVPEEGCVNDFVSIGIDRELSRPLFGSVDRVVSIIRWEQKPNAGTPGGQTYTQPFQNVYGRGTFETDQDRLTPNSPGEWYLHVDIAVFGKVLFSPRTQYDSYNSKTLFTALPESHPKCR